MSLLSPNLPLLILLGYLATAFSEFSSECAPPSRVDRFPNSRIDEIYAPFDTLRTDLEDYLWPTNASTVLTSSFADYRRTHFHEGIDISTNNQKGYPVYASRGGYVSRIHVSRRGLRENALPPPPRRLCDNVCASAAVQGFHRGLRQKNAENQQSVLA